MVSLKNLIVICERFSDLGRIDRISFNNHEDCFDKDDLSLSNLANLEKCVLKIRHFTLTKRPFHGSGVWRFCHGSLRFVDT